MKVAQDTVVSITYHLSDAGGPVLEQSDKGMPMAYLHGHGNILPALEEALAGHEAGEELSVTLTPEQAYGPAREGAVQKVPIKHLAGKYKRLLPGMLVRVNAERGTFDARVIKPGKFMVELDTNHPFAGKTLVFKVVIEEVRAASTDEISHGHAHGVGGHHH